MRGKLGPKTVTIEDRFAEPIMVSEEAAKVTDALHAQGKDAHKVSKLDVLIAAKNVLNLVPNGTNGEAKLAVNSSSVTPSEPAKPAEARKPKQQVKTTPPKPVKQVKTPPPKQVKAKPAPEPKKEAVKKPSVKQKVPQSETKAAPKAKAQPAPKSEQSTASEKPVEEDQVPECELPPEQQPLRLPPDFDYRNYPHYSVQSSIYSLLLSALNMAEHYEKFPEMEERQKAIEHAVKLYQNTCDPLKIKT